MIRVVLIDDHALVRSGVRAELERAHEVVAEAGGVGDAIDAIVRTKPDVVVCDVHLPDGTAACQNAKDHPRSTSQASPLVT